LSDEVGEINLEEQHRGPHHMRPSSRCMGTERNNIYPRERWPAKTKKHDNWHLLLVNLTSEETIDKIEKYTNEDGAIREEFFSITFQVVEKYEGAGVKTDDVIIIEVALGNPLSIEKRKKAWRVVFGEMNAYDAVQWIKREFIDKEWLPEELERRRAARELRKKRKRHNITES